MGMGRGMEIRGWGLEIGTEMHETWKWEYGAWTEIHGEEMERHGDGRERVYRWRETCRWKIYIYIYVWRVGEGAMDR